jgi:Flp pilus assembly protein TadG
MVEFAASFMAFLMVFFALIDFSLALNALVTLNHIAAASATRGTVDDPLGQICASDVQAAVQTETQRWGWIDLTKLTSTSTLNYQSASGTFHTRVRITYTYDFKCLPLGSITMAVSAVRVNEIQMFRPCG